jgi:dynein heavy chain
MEKGEWILLQNCHLSISWMPTLEKIVEDINPNKCHPDFRLWLTSMPSPHFPASILQSSIKITKEPPKGLRANLKSTYLRMDDEKLNATTKPEEYRKLLFGLAFFHAMVIERKKFGPLGWNIPYEFNDTDFDISNSQLELYMNQYEEIPYRVLRQLTSIINYGGRITDDKDLRTADILISTCIAPGVLNEDYAFSEKSNLFRTIETYNPSASHSNYMDYIAGLPLNASPEVFGMHSNANITCAISDVEDTFTIILSLQPRSSGSGGISREDQVIEMAKSMEAQLPEAFDIPSVAERYPTDYHESMNTVLVQEAARYTALVSVMHRTLSELQKALKGLVVLSADLEAMSNAIFDQKVPALWEDKAYPSLMPLGAWFKDLLKRLDFMGGWIERGTPPAFWISGFFFPQGFLTGTLQNYARKYQLPIDSISFGFQIIEEKGEEITEKPEDGCYIFGLFLEGARWSHEQTSLIDPKPKELFSPLPTMHLQPGQDLEQPKEGVYRCPVYKILTRTGTLSTTGHSTNFVCWILLQSNKEDCFRSSLVSETNQQVLFADQAYWIKAGVACFCALRYSL